MNSSLLLLRILHIAIGAFWVGAVVFIAAFLMPSVRAAGPASGAVMQQLMKGKLSLWLIGAAIVTVLSGFGLYWHDSAGFQSAWLASGSARVFGLGGLLAVAGVIVGMGVSAPAARRMGELAARIQAGGRPPTPDEAAGLERLQVRLARAGVAGAVLLLLATVAMAIARYVP